MSRFIPSYYGTVKDLEKKQYKVYSKLYKFQWSFHIIPSIHLYFDTYNTKNKKVLAGFYFSIQWIKWLYTFGLYRNLF